jgi:protein SCO1/2
MNTRFSRLALAGAFLMVLLAPGTAWAHPERVTGVVVSVLAGRHELVVRRDAVGTKPALTTLFQLSPKAAAAPPHAGDRIIGLVDDDTDASLLEDVRIVPQSAVGVPSAVRVVRPLSIGDRMPATRFVDQLGRPFRFADFRGKSVVLAFIYTRCRDPKECPAISSSFRALQQRFANGPYHLVEMTIDPDHDRPAVLARYGVLFGADPKRWTFGTGDPAVVLDFDARFGIDPFADPRLGLIHTERTVLIAPDGKIIDFIEQAGWSPADVSARLQPGSVPSNPFAWLDFELSKGFTAVCGNSVAGFSGLEDLAIVLVIFGSGAWVLQRVARKIFAH